MHKEILGLKSQKKGEAGAEQQAVLYCFLLEFWGDFLQVSWDKLYMNLANVLTYLRMYL